MGYSKSVYESAREKLKQRRDQAERDLGTRRNEFIRKYPELLPIERGMAESSMQVAGVLAARQNVREAMEVIAYENLAYQRRKAELVKSAGYPADYLELRYTCPHCRDEGFLKNKLCECHKKVLREIAFQQLNEVSPLKLCKFENFSFEYYSPSEERNGVNIRQKMSDIFSYCRDYAEHFNESAPSIFMNGPPGVGKTHLSLAIAGEVIDKGYGVIYGTAQNLLNKLQNEQFGRGGEERGTTEQMLLECDLLILDDLGTEFTNSYTLSAIYNIINTRLLSGKPVIISSNLTLKELEEKYSERITSRIMGGYYSFTFPGRDVRQIKKMKGIPL